MNDNILRESAKTEKSEYDRGWKEGYKHGAWASKPEPQAQAGEPEVVALRWPYKFRDIGETGAYEYHSSDFAVLAHLPLGEELITLQSHRKAIAKLQAEVDKWSDRAIKRTDDWIEAIDKKDAALKPLTDERWFQSELFKLAVQKGLLSVHTEHLAGGWSKDITKVSWMEGHNKACDISNEAANGIKEQA